MKTHKKQQKLQEEPQPLAIRTYTMVEKPYDVVIIIKNSIHNKFITLTNQTFSAEALKSTFCSALEEHEHENTSIKNNMILKF